MSKEIGSPPQLLGDRKYIEHFNQLPSILFSYNKKEDRITFNRIEDETFHLNCVLVESYLPQILSEIVLIQRSHKFNTVELINKLIESNPMEYDLSMGHTFYESKMFNFLNYYTIEYCASQSHNSTKDFNKIRNLNMFFNQQEFKQNLFDKIKFQVQDVPSSSNELVYLNLQLLIAK